MKRIAVFCDGTWNSPTSRFRTHVRRLYDMALHDPARQVKHYVTGIGTHGSLNIGVDTAVAKYAGGAFGWGMNTDIRDAYSFIARNYEPGDKILIFGFSRGAYTARSVAGMIRKCGIVKDPTAFNIFRAFRLYRQRGAANHPDAVSILRARQGFSPDVATSAADLDWRQQRIRGDQSVLVDIHFLGVWDTVGSLGLPEVDILFLGPLARLWNRRYRFHDTELSSLVQRARHAVALDERRAFFLPTLWSNLDDGKGGKPGLNRGSTAPDRKFQQVWFIGDHGMIGGSGANPGLIAIPLHWMIEGARKDDGLLLDPEKEADLADMQPDPTTPEPVFLEPNALYELSNVLLDWRDGPHFEHEMHSSVDERLGARAEYRPGSLTQLMLNHLVRLRLDGGPGA